MATFARNLLLAPALWLAAAMAAWPAEKSARAKAGATPPPKLKPENFHLLAEGEIPLSAQGAIVIDALTGASVYEKNADDPLFPASTTKILTALLVIEAGGLEKEIEVTAEDSKVGESSLNLKIGQRFTRRQMLYGLMLKSANDVAHALGRDNAGSEEAFAEKMTARARELGAVGSRFRNAHGLHAPDHFTTARDLAKITRAAMAQPLFRRIVGTQEYTWVADAVIDRIRNHNRMLLEFAGCTGVKTGFTNPAQHTLASAALREGREFIAVVMRSTKQGKWEDSKLLLTYGFAHPPTRTPPEAVRLVSVPGR